MTHELKIQKQWADAKLAGEKTFEIRRNDRGFQKGDTIRYKVLDPKTNEPYRVPASEVPFGGDNLHPLEHCDFLITYVIEGKDGLERGYCVYADQPVPRAKGRPEAAVDPAAEIPKIRMQLCELGRTVRALRGEAPERSSGECGSYEPDESFLVAGEKPCRHHRPEPGTNSAGPGTCNCPGCVHCGHACPTGGSRVAPAVTTASSPVSADLGSGATPSNGTAEPLAPPSPLAES